MSRQISTPLLQVRGLSKHFEMTGGGFFNRKKPPFRAIEDISFDLWQGEALGIVGESGSGKTTLGRTLLRAFTPTTGQALYDDGDLAGDLASIREKDLRPFRARMQMIFQDPFSSLNPRMTVGDIIAEPLVIQGIGTTKERRQAVEELLARVGLKPEHRARYPHAFSGGQRQRIGIARALILRPRLVVCDEALSALDVSVQAQVINLLMELQAEFGLTYLFIAHDLSVVRHLCQRIGVMYSGRIVELADREEIFNNPQHPYTRMLLNSVPDPNPCRRIAAKPSGEPASAGAKDFCAFQARCLHATSRCREAVPPLVFSGTHATACWHPDSFSSRSL